MKSVKHPPKPKLGRPATGRDPLISMRLPRDMLDAVNKWAHQHGMPRSVAVRRMIERGLKMK